jgi:hypothetical protein
MVGMPFLLAIGNQMTEWQMHQIITSASDKPLWGFGTMTESHFESGEPLCAGGSRFQVV